MPASIRAYNAANVTQFTTATATMSAAKPASLAVGDLWLIFHARRGIHDPEVGQPAGFSILGSGVYTGPQNGLNIYYKVADSADVAGGAKTWTVTPNEIAMTQSFAITGYDSAQPFSATSPVNFTTPSASTTHDATGITPDADGLVLVLASNSATATTYTAPTTQAGGWAEISDNQQGSSGPTRVTLAAFSKARTGAAGATGTITFGTSASVQVTVRTLHIRDEPPAPSFASKSQIVLYSANGLATDTNQVRYDLRALASDTQPVSYNVLGHSSKSAQLGYDLRGLTQKPQALSYAVKSLSGSARQALYNLATLCSQSRQALYNLSALSSSSRLISYDIRALASKNSTLLYDVLLTQLLAGQLGPLGFDIRGYATDTSDVRFAISARANSLRTLTFDARSLSGGTPEVRFAIDTRSGTGRSALYNISAYAGPSRLLGYDIRAYTSQNRALSYGISGLLGPLSRQLAFQINGLSSRTGIVRYNVLQTAGVVGDRRVLLFDIRALAEALAGVSFNLSSSTSQSRALSFDLMVRAAGSSQVSYAIRALSGSARTTIYDVLAHAILVSASRTLSYAISNRSGQNGSLQYDLNSLTGSPSTIYFHTRAYSSTLREMRYDVRGLTQGGRVVRFDVTFPVGIQRTIHYDLGGYVFVTRSVLYRVERLGAEFMVLVEGELLPASAILDDVWPVTLLEERMEAGADVVGLQMEAATLLGQKKLIVPTRLEEDISPAAGNL